MAVGHEPPPFARHLHDAHNLVEPLLHRELSLPRTQRPTHAVDHVAGRQGDPDHRGRDHGPYSRREARARGAGRHRDESGGAGQDAREAGQRQHGDTPLQAKSRQQHEARGERARDGAHGLREIKHSRPAAHGALDMLDRHTGEGKGEAHQERRHSHLAQHRRRAQLEQEHLLPPSGRGEDAECPGESVGAEQHVLPGGVAPIRPHAGEIAAHAEPAHEDGDDERGGVDGVAEDIAELADPDDLIDETAGPGAEEQRVQARAAH